MRYVEKTRPILNVVGTLALPMGRREGLSAFIVGTMVMVTPVYQSLDPPLTPWTQLGPGTVCDILSRTEWNTFVGPSHGFQATICDAEAFRKERVRT